MTIDESKIEYSFGIYSIKGKHIETGTIILIYSSNKSKEQLKKEMFARLEELVHKF